MKIDELIEELIATAFFLERIKQLRVWIDFAINEIDEERDWEDVLEMVGRFIDGQESNLEHFCRKEEGK